MDYRKMLQEYMMLVCYQEGTPFASTTGEKGFMVEAGLSEAEADEVITLAAEAYDKYRKEVA